MFWLDWCCKFHSEAAVPASRRTGDPRSDLALAAMFHLAKWRAKPDALSPLNWWFYLAVSQFVVPYLPQGAGAAGGDGSPAPLALALRRETARLLIDGRLPKDDIHWRRALGARAVYIDVPHGAILVDESLQLRAIFALPLPEGGEAGDIFLLSVITDRGSERPRGHLCAILRPDGVANAALDERGVAISDVGHLASFAEKRIETLALGRTADLFRLVLTYHFFGPDEVKEPIAVTPCDRVRSGKPRKDESLFAITRLNAAREYVHASTTGESFGASLTSQQIVSRHWKLQPYGPNKSLRKLIFVKEYIRGPEESALKPQMRRI